MELFLQILLVWIVLLALELSNACTQGLKAVHDLDIIHRDVKPQNIFLTADKQVCGC